MNTRTMHAHDASCHAVLVRMCVLCMWVGHVEQMSERCPSTRAQIDIPERDRHVRTHIHCENKSLIQSLALMRSAMSSGLGTRQPGS